VLPRVRSLAKVKLVADPARAQQRGVESLGGIRCHHEDHVGRSTKPIQHIQKGGYSVVRKVIAPGPRILSMRVGQPLLKSPSFGKA
jgi:hypothetical protein